MESVFGRYRNLIVLVGVLFAQVLGLAVQVRRTTENEPTRLIRIWAVGTVSPLEKALVWVQTSTGNVWHNYFYLRGVRAENRSLKAQIERMSLEQVRMSQDADQARRLQALLAFKEQFISQTLAAQVIGSSGSELSRVIYIDKGFKDGVKGDMAVITADGIVGKVLRADNDHVAQVLLIDDQTSGVGALLDKTRLQGILRGTPSGEVMLEKVMSDETVPPGELVLTSGGDSVFPKGLLVGRVTEVKPGRELFLNIRVRPAADLSRLEEVLVVTKIDEKQAAPSQTGAARAVDILAERLPGVPQKSDADKAAEKTAETVTNGAAVSTVPKGSLAGTSTTSGNPKSADPNAATPPKSGGISVLPQAAKTSTGVGGGSSHQVATPSAKGNVAGVPAKAMPSPAKPATQQKPQPPMGDSPQ